MEAKVKTYLGEVWEKVAALLKSRKFWALVSALVIVAQTRSLGQVTDWQALQAAIAALSAYSLGVAIEDNGKGGPPPTATVMGG